MGTRILIVAATLAVWTAGCGDAEPTTLPSVAGGVRVVTIDAQTIAALGANESVHVDLRPVDLYYRLDPTLGMLDYQRIRVTAPAGQQSWMNGWLAARSSEQAIDVTAGGHAEIAVGALDLFNVIFDAFRDLSCDACRTSQDDAAYCHDAVCWAPDPELGNGGYGPSPNIPQHRGDPTP